MNKLKLLKIAFAASVVALIACGALVFGRTVRLGNHYANAEQYAAGGTTLDGAVKNLEIDWTDGAVNIAYHAGNTVDIAETAPKAISADAALRWWLDGDTLRIQYAKSGYFSFTGLNKALTVTLPEGGALDSARIDVTSGEVNAPDLRATDVQIGLTSGDLALKTSGASQRVALSSTSGDIRADIADAGKLTIGVTSGVIRASVGHVDEVDISATSGDIALEGGAAQKVKIGSTSGKVDVRLTAFEALDIDATSGDITAALPSAPGYRADVSTTSGGFDYAVPLTRDGSAYACGDGSASVKIHTTSGNVLLTEAEE